MKTSCMLDPSILEDMPMVLVGVVESLLGLVGMGWGGKKTKKKENKK